MSNGPLADLVQSDKLALFFEKCVKIHKKYILLFLEKNRDGFAHGLYSTKVAGNHQGTNAPYFKSPVLTSELQDIKMCQMLSIFLCIFKHFFKNSQTTTRPDLIMRVGRNVLLVSLNQHEDFQSRPPSHLSARIFQSEKISTVFFQKQGDVLFFSLKKKERQ